MSTHHHHHTSDHLESALDLAAAGKVSPALEALTKVYKAVLADPFELWDQPEVFDLGSAFILAYHYDLSEEEHDNFNFVHLAYMYLERAFQLETEGSSGSFQELFGASDKLVEITKNKLMVLDQCEDELSQTLAGLIDPDSKDKTPADENRQKAIEKGRVVLKLIQFYELEALEEHFPELNDDDFLIEFSNQLEAEHSFGSNEAEMGKGFHQKLFDWISKNV